MASDVVDTGLSLALEGESRERIINRLEDSFDRAIALESRLEELGRRIALIEYGVLNRYHFAIPTSRALRYDDIEQFWQKIEEDIGEKVTDGEG